MLRVSFIAVDIGLYTFNGDMYVRRGRVEGYIVSLRGLSLGLRCGRVKTATTLVNMFSPSSALFSGTFGNKSQLCTEVRW